MNNFDTAYWTLAETLAWISKRDRDLVSYYGNDSVPESKDAKDANLPVALTLPVGLGLVSPGEESREKAPKIPPSPFRAALDELSVNAKAGHIAVVGSKRGAASRKEIDPRDLHGRGFFLSRRHKGNAILAQLLPGGREPRYDPDPRLDWWDDLLFRRDDVLVVCPESKSADKGRVTIAAKGRCRDWLVSQMEGGPKAKTKTAYAAEAKSKFNISTRLFNKAWDEAIEITGKTEWSNPGRRPTAA